jgi:hypothetical protein
MEAGRPSQHADGVIVAMAFDVGAGLDQQPKRLEVAMRRRKVHWRGIVREIALVEIGAALDQEADGAVPVADGGEMQGSGLQQAASA